MEKNVVVCPKCGMINSGKKAYCVQCGANIRALLNQDSDLANQKKNGRGKSKFPVAIIIILSVIVILAGGYGITKLAKKDNPVNKIVACMENGEYKDAKLLFDEKIETDTDDYEKLTAELKGYLEDNKNSFYEEKITYEQMKGVISAVNSFSIKELESDISDVKNYMEKIHDSRTAYQTAEAYMEKKDYGKAISNYAEVIMDDSYYETAQSRKQEAVDSFRSGVLDEAEKYVSDGDYTSGISVLKEAEKILENDSEIKVRKETYITEQKNNMINESIENAKIYHDNGDYEAALDELKKVDGYDNEMVTGLYESYYSEFLANVIEEAETEFNESGHLAAVKKLHGYKRFFEGDSTYEEEVEYYSGLAPVNLTEMDCFSSSAGAWKYSAYETDHLGNSFENCFEGGKGWREYYINSAYKSITGTIAYGADGYVGHMGKIEIYADDELVYSSPNVGAKTDPFTFSVNIEGKRYIEIKFVDITGWDWMRLILADAKLNKY